MSRKTAASGRDASDHWLRDGTRADATTTLEPTAASRRTPSNLPACFLTLYHPATDRKSASTAAGDDLSSQSPTHRSRAAKTSRLRLRIDIVTMKPALSIEQRPTGRLNWDHLIEVSISVPSAAKQQSDFHDGIVIKRDDEAAIGKTVTSALLCEPATVVLTSVSLPTFAPVASKALHLERGRAAVRCRIGPLHTTTKPPSCRPRHRATADC